MALPAAFAATAIVSAIGASTALAANATYAVLKCHASSRSAAEAISESRGAYSTQNRCAGADQRLELSNLGYATAGQNGFWRFNAPAGTEIVAVNARANLRRENHHLAQLVAVDAQGGTRVLANGLDSAQGYQRYSASGLDHVALVAVLICGDGGGCAYSEHAHAYVQNIEIVLADRHDPAIRSVGGGLVEPGWRRGSLRLQAQAADVGSGLEHLRARVNGVEVGRAVPACGGVLGGPYSSLLAPCPVSPLIGDIDLAINTAAAPFHDGPNALLACAEDFAGNAGSCASRTVWIDNSPPAIAFANRQDPGDPELIRVTVNEPHSGLDTARISLRPVGGSTWTPLATEAVGGELRARVDSDAVPAGEYEFRAEASDVAGNTAETTRHEDGTPMVLGFPLRERPRLVAGLGPGAASRQTIAYGHGSSVSGRLLDRDGAPLAGRDVTVVEQFGAGALIDRRVRVVSTDSRGAWTSVLPPGPSRTLTVAFAGTARFAALEQVAGQLTVRSRASFRTSRERVAEGGRVVFAGRIGHYAARMPAGGKLIELQVRESAGRWNTVREAFHTEASGRYRLGYRFGRFYESDARFRFRVKVAREQGWPYKAPVRSVARTVVVLAR
jgi:hypothetical protein